MTSFVFQGPAIGGPCNGREFVSYSKIFPALYRVQNHIANVHYIDANQYRSNFAIFRYHAQQYGEYWFFLPCGETLEDFLNQWNPPVEVKYWPQFLKQAIQALSRS